MYQNCVKCQILPFFDSCLHVFYLFHIPVEIMKRLFYIHYLDPLLSSKGQASNKGSLIFMLNTGCIDRNEESV